MHLSVEPCRKLQAKTVSCCYSLTETAEFIHASSSHSQPRHEGKAQNNHSSLHTMLNDKMRLGMLKITPLHQFSSPAQRGNPSLLVMTYYDGIFSFMLCSLTVHEMRLVRRTKKSRKPGSVEIQAVSPLKTQSSDSKGIQDSLSCVVCCEFVILTLIDFIG